MHSVARAISVEIHLFTADKNPVLKYTHKENLQYIELK